LRLFAALLLLIPGATALAHPSVSVVIDSHGAVYYSDLHDVWRISPDGTRSIVVPNVHSHELVLDSADNLYGEHLWYEGDATKKRGHRVWRRSPDGATREIVHDLTNRSVSRLLFERRHSVMGVYPDERGNVYAAVYGAGKVVRVDDDGRVVTCGREERNALRAGVFRRQSRATSDVGSQVAVCRLAPKRADARP
jgi:hypothetical protein